MILNAVHRLWVLWVLLRVSACVGWMSFDPTLTNPPTRARLKILLHGGRGDVLFGNIRVFFEEFNNGYGLSDEDFVSVCFGDYGGCGWLSGSFVYRRRRYVAVWGGGCRCIPG